MKNQKNILQLRQFQISSSLIIQINGGEKKEAARADEEIE